MAVGCRAVPDTATSTANVRLAAALPVTVSAYVRGYRHSGCWHVDCVDVKRQAQVIPSVCVCGSSVLNQACVTLMQAIVTQV